MFVIQCSYVFVHSSGTITVLPERTASSAGSASGFVFTNHCVEIIGSTIVPERSLFGSMRSCCLLPRARPFSSRAFFTALRATKRSIPANAPQVSFSLPSIVRMLSSSSLWRLPVAKSLKSCAGVTFTAPVPNVMSTSSASQITGIVRSTNGCWRRLPCRCW